MVAPALDQWLEIGALKISKRIRTHHEAQASCRERGWGSVPYGLHIFSYRREKAGYLRYPADFRRCMGFGAAQRRLRFLRGKTHPQAADARFMPLSTVAAGWNAIVIKCLGDSAVR